MVWPAIIAAGASLVGGALANRANAKMADKQMDFQEYMSNTAYQRSMEDMRLAGLNPMLAYSQGGASSPPGARAEMRDIVTPAVSSAVGVSRNQAEVALMKTGAEKNKADAQAAASQAFLNYRKDETELQAQARLREEVKNLQWTNLIMQENLTSAKAGAAGAKVEAEIDQTKYGQWLRYLQRLNPFTGGAKGVSSEVREWKGK